MLDSQPNSDETSSEIGKQLAKAREAAGKSAKACALVLGVPLKKYLKIETGEIITSLPDVSYKPLRIRLRYNRFKLLF